MEIAKKVFACDPNILLDAKNLRQSDSHRLLRRLDIVHQQAVLSELENFVENDVRCFIRALVETFLSCTESIKVSRAIEKLWKHLMPKYGDVVESCFQQYIFEILNGKIDDKQSVSRFSVLLEQNKTIQEIVRRELSAVVNWILEELSPLLQLAPHVLSVSQCQCVYALIKIILQLFQCSGEDLGALIHWENEEISSSSLQQHSRRLCSSLIHILCVKGYQTDCVLLTGTATALMLNCVCKPVLAERLFHQILESTLTSECPFDLDTILQKVTSDVTRIDNERFRTFTDTNIGTIALLRGVVACGSNDILQSDLDNHLNTDYLCRPLFIKLFEYIISLCYGNITLSYHCFQVLLLWYQRLSKTVSSESVTLIQELSMVITQTLDVVMLNWDSPVEDVPDAVVDIFDHMMSVWTKERGVMPDFPWIIVKTLQHTDWSVKGKYRILAVLVKYVDHRRVLVEYPDIQGQLLQCLTTNHLASTCTNVYRAFIAKSQNQSDTLETWKLVWLDSVLKGLVHENSLLCYNTSLHWIPVTLRLVPLSGECLQDKLSSLLKDKESTICYTRLLHAWIVVTKTIRVVTGHADLEDCNVRKALHCLEEDVRSEAICLVCSTLKKAEPVSETEISLLQEALRYNIKIDSAPFRQHLGSNIRKLLTRLRDSSITALKALDRNGETLGRSIEFVDWLHKLCIDCLLPGACYQRRKGSLDLLHVIYETLIFRQEDKQRKGFTPETTVQLFRYARSVGKWDFFCDENIHVLIVCILDGASEIHNSAFILLTKYFDFPLETGANCTTSLSRHLLKESLRLCNSPKGHESDSGSVLCKLVFQKYVIHQSMRYSLDYEATNNTYKVKSCIKETGTSQHFIHSLLDETKRQMKQANENLVKASKLYPVHGLISAVTRCLTETQGLFHTICPNDSVNIVTKLVEICHGVVDDMLKIMASVAEQEACPSFAEIGVAMETLLLENQSDYSQSTSQSPEFQYMLSWCWNNINESCTCLGDVTQTVVQNCLPLSHIVIEKISSTFITVLTKCRHKGVIEGCKTAFVKFCSALFTSNKELYSKLPATILSEVLNSLRNKIISSSVTRRSAGIPIIVQAVLVGEKKVKKTNILKSSVQSLFEIAQLPLEVDSGQTDLPQVHGLNILNSLFSDASLSSSLTGYISNTVVMVIKQFGSPSWAVRNAATRLFSTLVTRIFGQKKTTDNTLCNTVTFQEFSSYYPELPPFLTFVLKEASSRDILDITNLHPGLFPVLTLLSCLSPPNTQSESLKRDIEEIKLKVLPFLASPVYQVRQLVASAVVSMVNTADIIVVIEKMINECCVTSSCNYLHGSLLCITQIINHLKRQEDIDRVIESVIKLHHVLDHVPLISTVYVKLLTTLVSKHPTIVLPTDILHNIQKIQNSHQDMNIGFGMLIEESVHFLFLYNQLTPAEILSELLQSPNQDTRKACLEYMTTNTSKQAHVQDHVMRLLCSVLKAENYIPNVCTALQLITKLYRGNKSIPSYCVTELKTWLRASHNRINQYMCLYAASLPVWAIVVQHEVQIMNLGMSSTSDINIWCDSLVKSSVKTNETQRMAVTQALLIAGQSVLYAAVKDHSPYVSILECCMTLVQDEDIDIRQEACIFVSSLEFSTQSSLFKYSSLHSNICYELLLEYIVTQFHNSSMCMDFLIGQLYTQGHLVKVIQEKQISRFQQLFDQEDNSFFAEKIYNAFSIYKNLKQALKHYPSGSIRSCLEGQQQGLRQDVVTLIEVLQTCVKDTVINLCTDNTILASICSVLLMCDLSGDIDMKEKVFHILKLGVLPKYLQRQIAELIH